MVLADKVAELQQTTATLIERVDHVLTSLDAIDNAKRENSRELAELRRELTDLRREYEKEFALLKREIDDLKKWKDEQKKEREERSRKLWSFGPNILGAVVSGFIAAAVAYFVARR